MSASDSAPHLTDEFRETFSSWEEYQAFLAEKAHTPAYDAQRATHVSLLLDVTARLTRGEPWLIFGSLLLPARSPEYITSSAGSHHLAFTEEATAVAGSVPPPHALARSAFDGDLLAQPFADDLEPGDSEYVYGKRVLDRVQDAIPPGGTRGLGGLVTYSVGNMELYENGQVMGVVNAQPIDTRYGPRSSVPVAEPIPLEIDIKPPSKVRYKGDPEPAQRSLLGVEIPGFTPPDLPLLPVATQLADKLSLLCGPPRSMRGSSHEPWHRWKDVFDIYFLCTAATIHGEAMQAAVEGNWNFTRMEIDDLPRPYRVYGQDPVPDGETPIPWEEKCQAFQHTDPALNTYPPFSAMMSHISEFVEGIPHAGDKQWVPSLGWASDEQLATRDPHQPLIIDHTARHSPHERQLSELESMADATARHAYGLTQRKPPRTEYGGSTQVPKSLEDTVFLSKMPESHKSQPSKRRSY